MSLRTEILAIVANEPPETRKLELARLYASHGWYVFPLAANSKLPLKDSHGLLDASTKADDIEAWWGEHPDWNIGIACGRSGLVVLDPDLYKDGVPERWAELSEDCGLLDTFTVETPKGGAHYYLSRNGTEFGSQNDWLPGIDCKSNGGYVVAPGSVVEGKPYLPLTDEDVSGVPEAWASRLPVKNSDIGSNGSRSESRHAYTRDRLYALAADGQSPTEAAKQVLDSFEARSMLRDDPARARELVLSAVGAYEKIKFAAPTVAATTKVDPATALPPFPDSCWRDDLALVREVYSPNTEAPDSFIYVGAITALSLTVGTRAALKVPWGWEPLNLFSLGVGQSARAKKNAMLRVVRALVGDDAGCDIWAGWPASPQALTEIVIEAGTTSLLFELDEFSNLLKLMKTEIGAAFAQDINRMYDLKPLSRRRASQKTLRTEGYFVSIIGANTRTLVHKDLDLEEAVSGFAGRFCYFGGDPKPAMAWPDDLDLKKLGQVRTTLADLSERIEFAAHEAGGTALVTMTDPAKAIFTNWYEHEHDREYPNEILETIAGRLQNHALRLAALLAILSGRWTVEAEDISAGIEFADYQRQMQAYLFTGFGANREEVLEAALDAKIQAMKTAGVVTRRACQQALRKVEGLPVRASEFNTVFRLYCSNRDIQITDGGTLKFPAETEAK